MKVIDLLNKIANGEEVPEHIKIGKNEWYFYKSRNTYGDKKSAWIVWDWYVEENRLNDEVEILEDKKILEKLDYCEENTFMIKCKENSYLTREEMRILDSNFKEIGNKINEIIDYLKSKGE